jgi:hypothetical protein
VGFDVLQGFRVFVSVFVCLCVCVCGGFRVSGVICIRTKNGGLGCFDIVKSRVKS